LDGFFFFPEEEEERREIVETDSNGVKTLERKSCNAAEMRGQLIDRSSGT